MRLLSGWRPGTDTPTPLLDSAADVGKVLCGLQIPEGESSSRFDGWLQGLAYPYVEETQAWSEFMGGEDSEEEEAE